jgi:hypothetical protein
MKLKQSDRAILMADKKLHQECRRQVLVIYGSAGIALSDHWEWGQKRILDIYDLTDAVWEEVGEDNDISMLQLLEDETGIEIQLTDSSKSWHDLDYLNGKREHYEQMTKAQFLYMRQQQCRWMSALIQACLYLALHRKYGWGAERIKRIMDQIDEIRSTNSNKEGKITGICHKKTGINIVEYYTRKRARNHESK